MNQNLLLNTLSSNLACNIPELQRLYILKHGKELIYSSEIQKAFGSKVNHARNQYSSINFDLDPILRRIQEIQSDSPYANAIIDAENFRSISIFVDEWTFIYIVSIDAWIDKLQPFLYLATEKFYRILSENQSVDLEIPKLGEILGSKLLDSSSNEIQQWVFKFTLVGDSGVGKTSLVNRFVDGVFPKDFRPTIGLNIMTHTYTLMENRVHLNIYDIGSQKFFKRVRRSYYKGTMAVILVFDLHDRKTFDHIHQWKSELDSYIEGEYESLLVGNKSDLSKVVSTEEANNLASKYNMGYLETSALNNINVEDAFVLLVFKILTKRLKSIQI
ncbi:MAG: GTP-binding protein [Candidatus Lokiarchaeota archaeon]|nr:GTP-binding protein [Candidatus Harpocratesius repetitus]